MGDIVTEEYNGQLAVVYKNTLSGVQITVPIKYVTDIEEATVVMERYVEACERRDERHATIAKWEDHGFVDWLPHGSIFIPGLEDDNG